MTEKPVKSAVYYNYEGETLIITKDDDNPACIVLETYDSTGHEAGRAMTYITMLYSEWQNLVKKVDEL